MKILWFTNIPMPDVDKYYGRDVKGTGGWMGALLELLKNVSEIRLGVVTACTHYPDSFIQKDGVDYFIIKQKGARLRRSILPVDNNPVYLHKCIEIINTWKPDIVHIHGTERFWGRLVSQNLVDSSVVVSIQGIMDSYQEWYHWFGKMKLKDIFLATFTDTLKGSGLLWDLRTARLQAQLERSIFRKCKYFFGRTEWDKAYVEFYNPWAKYFYVSEVLRKAFWKCKWRLVDCRRHSIIFTNIRHPRKGAEVLITAIQRLHEEYPDIELRLIGSPGCGSYARWLKKQLGPLRGVVKFLGQMNAEEISRELCRAHVFVSASYIENSPNSVAEAQLVGMPVISTFTGGVPSMIKNGESGMFFPTGDVPLLVKKIRTIFENDTLAQRLGENARVEATKRHDPDIILNAQIAAYKSIIADSQMKNA